MAEWSQHGSGELDILSLNHAGTWPFYKVSSSGRRNPHGAIQPCVQL